MLVSAWLVLLHSKEGATLGYQGAQDMRDSQLKREKLIPIDLQHAGCPLNFMDVYTYFFQIYTIFSWVEQLHNFFFFLCHST